MPTAIVLAENPTATGFVLRRDYDLSNALRGGETLNSVLPDSLVGSGSKMIALGLG